jgi:putative membrane protein
MIAAFTCSAVFLASYLTYHAQVGSVRFPGTGAARTLYLGILLTHTVLAAAVAPMAIVTFSLAWRGRFEKHRRLARWTLPIWLYVSVTGVVVYVMLYRMKWNAPSGPARAGITQPGIAQPGPRAPAAGLFGQIAQRFSRTTFHPYAILDKAQGGLRVSTIAVPDGWTATSRVVWTYAATSWPVQVGARFAAADGSAWLETFPAECFYWLEPPDRSTRVGAKSLGMIHRPGLGARDAMTWLIARTRGGAKNFHVVGFRPIPNLAAALGKPAFAGDSVAARVRYTENGHTVDEEFFLVLGGNRIPYHGPQGTSYENHRVLAYAHSMGARDGRLDGLHPLLGYMMSSIQLDPVWDRRRQQIQSQLTAQFDRNLAAGYSRIAAAGALSRQISANNDAMIASMDAQRAASNRSAAHTSDSFSQYIRGTERMQDPYWGTSEHSYTEKYHWTDGQGGYQHSNDAGFNPNVGGTGNWQLMQPAK